MQHCLILSEIYYSSLMTLDELLWYSATSVPPLQLMFYCPGCLWLAVSQCNIHLKLLSMQACPLFFFFFYLFGQCSFSSFLSFLCPFSLHPLSSLSAEVARMDVRSGLLTIDKADWLWVFMEKLDSWQSSPLTLRYIHRGRFCTQTCYSLTCNRRAGPHFPRNLGT